MAYECYDKIVGLSQDDCECSVTDRPADYNVSNSGLFVGDLPLISDIVSLNKCGSNWWALMQRAVDSTVKTFVARTNALMGDKMKLKRVPAKGQVLSQIKARDPIVQEGNYAYLRMTCAPIRGMYFHLKSLGTLFEGTGVLTLSIYNNVDGFIQDVDLNTTANKLNKNSQIPEIKLPLFSKYVEYLEYYFVYEIDPANLAKDNQSYCGCGSKDLTFNIADPYFELPARKHKTKWYNFVMTGGGQLNSLSELTDTDLPDVMPEDCNGLVLCGDFSCSVSEVLCEDALDFDGNPLAMSMAIAIQHGAAAYLAAHIRTNPSVGEHNITNLEAWELSEIEWREVFEEQAAYVASQADYTANDCFECPDVLKMARHGLFS